MLKGRAAVITGSTSGIGLGIAQALAGQGANVMLNGFTDEETVQALKRELGALGVKVEYHPCDVTRPEQVDAMVEAAVSAFGSLDILVNNAGIQHVAPVEQFPLEKWDAVIATNMSSAFYGMRRAVPLMRRRGWGRIINTASVHGLVASAQKIAYVAAKHGVIGMTKVVALETAGSGVTCNSICPGWVLTPLVQKQIDQLAAKKGLNSAQASEDLLAEKQPSRQFVTPEQIGALAVFLCSDAAAQITGASYTLDGGWTAQ
ncbi:MAG TPA: 3-hydroxybutyrate dehydrogenase [Pseudomonadota bacterium]|nr:3-hydroxybutyrate dehydrogenase [Pseudomonadota bacterium]